MPIRFLEREAATREREAATRDRGSKIMRKRRWNERQYESGKVEKLKRCLSFARHSSWTT